MEKGGGEGGEEGVGGGGEERGGRGEGGGGREDGHVHNYINEQFIPKQSSCQANRHLFNLHMTPTSYNIRTYLQFWTLYSRHWHFSGLGLEWRVLCPLRKE